MPDTIFPALSDPTYRLDSEIGAGGGGVVYKAWHTRLEKDVVVKRIKDESGLASPTLRRAEADILKNLKHANLPQIYDFLSEESGVYTVMEFIPGQSFAELLRDGKKYTQPEVIRWAVQLADALTYLHGQKPPVLHSDIKPANIMLTPKGDVCLIDFNVSLLLTDADVTALGISHGYASPEQYGPQALPKELQIAPANAQVPKPKKPQETVVLNEPQSGETAEMKDPDATKTLVDRGKPAQSQPSLSASGQRRAAIRMDTRSDIYSLGATLYHLLTGVKPAIATGDIKPIISLNPQLSEGVVYIVERCMERDPEKRFASAEQLLQALIDIRKLDGRWKKQRARSIAAAVVLSALFLCSAASAAFGYVRMGEEKVERYNILVLEIASDRGDGAYEEAVALFPEKIEAYHEQALKMFNAGAFEDCAKYTETALASLTAYLWDDYDLKMIGNLYYILGNCRMENEDYPNAVASFETAIANNPDNPEMTRDYAIALARCGYVERAEDLVEEIEDMGLRDESVTLLRGEIAYAKADYNEAAELFYDVIDRADDDYIRQRAYLICDRVLRHITGREAANVSLLRDAISDLPARYAPVLKERLADALVRQGKATSSMRDACYTEAAEIFDELINSGNPSYTTRQNIGVLYQEMGDFDTARTVFEELTHTYPTRYEPFMRLSYLELEIQSGLRNEQRNYIPAKQWYDDALDNYEARPSTAPDDMEMLQLTAFIDELRQYGWI